MWLSSSIYVLGGVYFLVFPCHWGPLLRLIRDLLGNQYCYNVEYLVKVDAQCASYTVVVCLGILSAKHHGGQRYRIIFL